MEAKERAALLRKLEGLNLGIEDAIFDDSGEVTVDEKGIHFEEEARNWLKINGRWFVFWSSGGGGLEVETPSKWGLKERLAR